MAGVSRGEFQKKNTRRAYKVRNRLILELMARGGMRMGEVLKLTLGDIQSRKLILQEPKSGKQREFVFIPQKAADRLKDYVVSHCEKFSDRVFTISYEAARLMVLKLGKMVGISIVGINFYYQNPFPR